MVRTIVDPKEYDTDINNGNKAILKDFLIEKKAQRKTVSTIRQYNNDLRIILTIVYRRFENKLLTDLTRKDIRNIAIIFQDMGMSNARVNRLLSTLRSSLEFCADDDDYEYEHNTGSRVKGLPKAPVREITFLTEEQVHWLRDKLLEKGETMQAVYLMLSYVSAARKNEIHQVKKDGLSARFFTNVVIGKRQKKFKLYYNADVQSLIKRYLDERGDDENPDLFVLVQKDGTRRTVHSSIYNSWCTRFGQLLSEKEGRKIHVNPHCFRHTRLEVLSRSGVPIEKLKTLANHSDISTTASYLAERNEDDIAEIFGMSPDDFTY